MYHGGVAPVGPAGKGEARCWVRRGEAMPGEGSLACTQAGAPATRVAATRNRPAISPAPCALQWTARAARPRSAGSADTVGEAPGNAHTLSWPPRPALPPLMRPPQGGQAPRSRGAGARAGCTLGCRCAPCPASSKRALSRASPPPCSASSRGGGSHARAGSQKKATGQKHDLLKQATSNQAKKLKVGPTRGRVGVILALLSMAGRAARPARNGLEPRSRAANT